MVNATVLKTVGSYGLYGFESCLLRQSQVGLVAQWLEQDPYKVLVAGSNPAEPTIIGDGYARA